MDILNYVSQIYYLEYLAKKEKLKVLLELLFLNRNNYGIIISIFSKYMFKHMKKYPIYINVAEAVDDVLIAGQLLPTTNNLQFLQHLTRLIEIDTYFLYLALFAAVKNKNYAIIKYLVNNRNLDINYIDNEAAEGDQYGDYHHHVTALFLAIYYDDLDMVKFLIEEMGADPNVDVTVYVYMYTDTKFNALQYAIYMESKPIVKYLMDNYDIDYMRIDKYGNNVMMLSLSKLIEENAEQFDTVLVDVINHPKSELSCAANKSKYFEVIVLARQLNFTNVLDAVKNLHDKCFTP